MKKNVTSVKGIVFFFPGKVHRSFIHSNPKMLFFFFREAGKKNTSWFFSITGKVHRSFIWILRKSVFFYKIGCVFFFPHFCVVFVFFFSTEKFTCHSFIQFWRPEKKNTIRKKKTAFSFIHSIFLKKCTKTNFSGEIKKYDTFAQITFLRRK